MSEFNLVPQEFYARESKRRALWMSGGVVGAVLALMIVGYVFVGTYVAAQETEVAELRQQKAISMQQRERLKELQERKETLQGDLLLLSSLRSGVTMPELVRSIETARTTEDVRFTSWHFRRQGIRTESDKEPMPPSYFFSSDKPGDFPKYWESMTHMSIQGEAKDHAALSGFVQSLFGHPIIDDVRIQRSTQSATGVSFHLAVVVRTEEGQS